jgi:hypothetical protein
MTKFYVFLLFSPKFITPFLKYKNMKKLIYLILLSIVFFQCKPNTPEPPAVVTENAGTLRIHFLPTYENQPLYMNKELKHNGNLPIKFQRLSLFSNLVSATATSPTQKVDFSNIYDENAAKQGVLMSLKMGSGTFDKLQIGIGVDRTSNKKIPSDYKNGDPLAEVGDYWDSWNSYIFTKTEGKFDADGSGKFASGFSYHTGTDEMYRVFNLPNTVTISNGKVTDINIEIDFKKVLNGSNGAIDPLKEKNAHSLANKPVAIKIMDNYITAFSVK